MLKPLPSCKECETALKIKDWFNTSAPTNPYLRPRFLRPILHEMDRRLCIASSISTLL
jgi:hypothetical protein